MYEIPQREVTTIDVLEKVNVGNINIQYRSDLTHRRARGAAQAPGAGPCAAAPAAGRGEGARQRATPTPDARARDGRHAASASARPRGLRVPRELNKKADYTQNRHLELYTTVHTAHTPCGPTDDLASPALGATPGPSWPFASARAESVLAGCLVSRHRPCTHRRCARDVSTCRAGGHCSHACHSRSRRDRAGRSRGLDGRGPYGRSRGLADSGRPCACRTCRVWGEGEVKRTAGLG